MSKTVVACAENQAAYNHLSLVAARCLGGRREQYRFSVLKAMKSLKLYPLPIESVEEALALEGVGPALAKELMKAVEASKKKSFEPRQNNDNDPTALTIVSAAEQELNTHLPEESLQLSQYSQAIEMSVPLEDSSAHEVEVSNLGSNRIRKKSSALSTKRRIEETSPESSPTYVRNRQNSSSTINGQNLMKEPPFRRILLEIPDSPQLVMTASESVHSREKSFCSAKIRAAEGEHANDNSSYHSESDYQPRKQSHLKMHSSDSADLDRKNMKKLPKFAKRKAFQSISAMKENISNNIHFLDLTQSDPTEIEHVEKDNSNMTIISQSTRHFLQSSPLPIDEEYSADHVSCVVNSHSDSDVAVFESQSVLRACDRSRTESSIPSLSQLNILDMASRQSSLSFEEDSRDNAVNPKISLTFSQSSFGDNLEEVGGYDYNASYSQSTHQGITTSCARSNQTSSSSSSSSTFAFSAASAFYTSSSAASLERNTASSASHRQHSSSFSRESSILRTSSSSAAIAAITAGDSDVDIESNVRKGPGSSSSRSKSKTSDPVIPKLVSSKAPRKCKAPSAKQKIPPFHANSKLKDRNEIDTNCLVVESSDEDRSGDGDGDDPCDPHSEHPTVDPFLGPLLGPVSNWEPVLIVDSREKDRALVQVR